jgi:hypothetical protein
MLHVPFLSSSGFLQPPEGYILCFDEINDNANESDLRLRPRYRFSDFANGSRVCTSATLSTRGR